MCNSASPSRIIEDPLGVLPIFFQTLPFLCMQDQLSSVSICISLHKSFLWPLTLIVCTVGQKFAKLMLPSLTNDRSWYINTTAPLRLEWDSSDMFSISPQISPRGNKIHLSSGVSHLIMHPLLGCLPFPTSNTYCPTH